MSRPDQPLDAPGREDGDLDGEECRGENEAVPAEGDGPAPASSLTSLRLTRRRPGANPKPPARPKKPGPVEQKTDTPAESHRPGSIVDYWSRLRGQRPYPAPEELNSELITATWPNAILLRRYDGESGLRAAALYKPDSDPSSHNDRTLDLSPMIVEWILSLAERTVGSGQPIVEKESFERPCGSVRYAAYSLPLGKGEADHVLCYLRVLG